MKDPLHDRSEADVRWTGVDTAENFPDVANAFEEQMFGGAHLDRVASTVVIDMDGSAGVVEVLPSAGAA
jgi:hypothetical protein